MEMAGKTDNWHTFIWKIENLSHCWEKQKECLSSPNFHIQDTDWCLQIFPRGKSYSHYIACYIKRVGSSGLKYVKARFKIALMGIDGSYLTESDSHYGRSFQANETNGFETFVHRNEVFCDERKKFLPNDTLTVCCCIFNTSAHSRHFRMLARTRIEVQWQTIALTVGHFSDLDLSNTSIFDDSSLTLEKPVMKADFYLSEGSGCDENLIIDIISGKNEQRKFATCNVFLLDAVGNKTKCGKSDICFDPTKIDQIWKFPLIFTKWDLIAKKDLYLPNDVLSLQIECSSSVGIYTEISEETEFLTYECTEDEVVENELSALEDLGNLLKENILCDVNLQTITNTFPAHKAILSARSPVFKAMFTNDSKEKATNRVEIGDLDDKTIRRLLLYIYTKRVEDIQWQFASQLYVAADKYCIGSLKKKCSFILVESLVPSNVCKILELSDRHQDVHLKNLVCDYILDNDKDVLESNEWKDLELKHPRLTSETMSHIYRKSKEF